jgi:hypothetical protein
MLCWRQFTSIWSNEETWLFVTRLDTGTTETYYRWQLLNPSHNWRHHSAEVWFNVFPRFLLSIILDAWLLNMPFLGYIPAYIGMLMLIGKGFVYRFIVKKVNGKMSYFWTVVSIINHAYFMYAIYAALGQPKPDEYNLSLDKFLSTRFYGSRDGSSYLYSAMMSGSFSRVYSIHSVYPMSITLNLLVFVRASQGNWLVLRSLVSAQMSELLQLSNIQMLMLNIIFYIYRENTYRVEFKTTYEHILTKAFLDQCLDICQQDIRKPLELLLERQKDLVKVVVHAAYCRLLLVDRALLGRMEPLHVSHLLLAETVSELSYSRSPLLMDTDAPVGRCPMDTVELSRAVSRIVSGFSSAAADHHVRIFAEVDNRLAVVLVDWKMLSMLITNLVSAALRNIRDYCTATPRNLDLINYIMIKFTAIESEAKVPFVAPRLMLVNVCDSSDGAMKAAREAEQQVERERQPGYFLQTHNAERTVESSADGKDRFEAKYGRTVCERLARRVSPSPIFETIAVKADMRTAQRFTFPYHLTPQTRKAQEFIEGETEKPFLTVSVSIATYLQNYHRLVLNSAAANAKPGQATKQLTYFSGVASAQRSEVSKLIKRFDAFSWACNLKYLLSVPSLHSVASADCVLLDQQLEILENVNICDTVLKLRVCGFNGVIAVILQDGLRNTDVIKDELSRSAAHVDLVIMGPIKDQHIQLLTVALEKKCIRQLVNMNGE